MDLLSYKLGKPVGNDGLDLLSYKLSKGSGGSITYLESTGTQYINTGVIPNVNYRAEITFQFTENTPSTGTRVMGSRVNFNSRGFYLGTSNNQVGQNWYVAMSRLYGTFDVASDYNKHTIILGTTCYLDGTQIYTFNSPTSFAGYGNTILFGSLDGFVSSTEPIKSAYKLYGCKIWKSDELIRDFIPALDENKVPCLFDKVSETYYYNQGTGTFLYG